MKKYLLILLIVFPLGCGIVYRNRIYDEFNAHKPRHIGIILTKKSILERPSIIDQFSSSSVFPDTLDKGMLGYRPTAKEANLLEEFRVIDVFREELQNKGYECFTIASELFQQPDTIINILEKLKPEWKSKVQAILFTDYSEGVIVRGDWRGYLLYYRYALFSLETGDILIRHVEVVRNLGLLRDDFRKNFPSLVN